MSEPPSAPLSRTETLVGDGSQLHLGLSSTRKWCLLAIFCMSQFLDACNASMLFPAIPAISATLNMKAAESAWIISSYQLTFAAFLLISGRIADLYSPRIAFVVGMVGLGVVSLIPGFAHNKIMLLTFRAFGGVFASLTIPSALTLLVKVFPEPKEQARAIGIFGGCGAIGNVLGLTLGAIIVEFTSWRWIFWFATILAIIIAVGGLLSIPSELSTSREFVSRTESIKSLDMAGVSSLTVAVILFIFALTSGAASGWGTAMVLVPLCLSVVLTAGFFYWETVIPAKNAAIPPSTWFYPNFAVLFGVSLLPYFWWTTSFVVFTTLWQDVFGWSAISTAIRMFPMGVLAFLISFTGPLSQKVNSKWLILGGHILMVVATILLAFAGTPDRYWPLVFPGFVVGSAGAMFVFVHTSIAIFDTTPSSIAGTVGAMYNSALQLGSAVGLAIVSSLEASVEKQHENGFLHYQGRAAAYWFLLGIVCVELAAVVIFYKLPRLVDIESPPVAPDLKVEPSKEITEEKVRVSCESDEK